MTPTSRLLAELRSRRPTDYLAIGIAISLPWSTTATGILMALWLLAVAPIADFPALRREIATPEGGLPVLLVVLAALGMLWADVGWADRFDGLEEFGKLLFVPVVLTYFRQSDAGLRVILGFLASCIVLLAVALATALWPGLQWWESWGPGVPVRNYITQSAEFAISAFWLLYLALDAWRAGARRFSIAALCIACVFIGFIIFVVTSRTELIIIVVLLLLFAAIWYGRKGLAWGLIALPIAAFIAWSTSDYLRTRVDTAISQIGSYRSQEAPTSIGYRLEFWKKSIGFIAAAPVAGHGTGSIESLFEKDAVGKTGLSATVTSNPHNQIFAVAIQLGMIGVAVLCAMWFVHLRIFLGPGLAAWFGTVVVIQIVLGSLFNSHLFDFTEGWMYVLGVGALAGVCRRTPDTLLSRRRPSKDYLAHLVGK